MVLLFMLAASFSVNRSRHSFDQLHRRRQLHVSVGCHVKPANDREVYITGLGCGRIEKSRPIDLSVGMRPDLLDRAARIAEE
jgi:hypothetical protein